MSNSFKAHGKFTIEASKHILLVDVEGPWNVEFVTQLHLEVIEKIKKVDVNNFAVLLLPRGDALSVNDAINYHTAFIKQAKNKVIAVNLSASSMPLLTKELLEKVYKTAEMKHAFFNDTDAAKSWIFQQLKVKQSDKKS